MNESYVSDRHNDSIDDDTQDVPNSIILAVENVLLAQPLSITQTNQDQASKPGCIESTIRSQHQKPSIEVY
jgi:hypothetical protein